MANDNFALGIGVVAGLGYLFTRMKDDKEEFREEEWSPRFYRKKKTLKKAQKQTQDAEMIYRKYKGRKGPALSATSVKRGTRRRGNDGKMWEVRKSGKSQRWFQGAESFEAEDWDDTTGKVLIVADHSGNAYLSNNEKKMRKAIQWAFLTSLEDFDEDMADHMGLKIDEFLEDGKWGKDSDAKILKWWYSLPLEKAVLYANMYMQELDLDDVHSIYADGPDKAIVFGAESFSADEHRKQTKNEIIDYLLSNCDGEEYYHPIFHTVNDDTWTIADLFVRQYLNNGSDGFGMSNVHEVYGYLVDNKEQLIEYDLISKDGTNNSGFGLWEDYNFSAESFSAEECGECGHRMAPKWVEYVCNCGHTEMNPSSIICTNCGGGELEPKWIEYVCGCGNTKGPTDFWSAESFGGIVACKQDNCPHGHCPRCGNCDDVLDNDGDGSEDDDNPMFCGACGESFSAESFEAEGKICKDCGETYEDCDMFLNPDCERLEGVELSHEDKATRIYEGIQQNINNPETVRFYYELFYGEPPAEDYEGDMALDVIEAVSQNLNGEAFVDYMYGEIIRRGGYGEMYDAESFEAESGYCESCGIDGQFWGDGKARTECYKCGGVTIIDEYKDAESFEAEWDFGDDRESLRKGDEHSDFNNAWRWIFKTKRREWPEWGQKFYDKYEWTLDDPHWNPQLDAESFGADEGDEI